MSEPVIISVGGGKGGIGKSVTTANLAAALAARGFRVGLIDGDLRGANLHLCVGVKRPRLGLQDFIAGRAKTLSEVACETVIPNTWLIAGASDIVNLANPRFAQKQKIISALRKTDADYVFVDLGAGSDHQVCDFFAAFTYGIVVIDSLPTSIENAYGFLKNGIIRGLVRLFPGQSAIQDAVLSRADPSGAAGMSTIPEIISAVAKQYPDEARVMKTWLHAKKTFLVISMVKESEDLAVGGRFHDLVKRYLGIDIFYVGYVLFSSDIRKSIRNSKPLVQSDPAHQVSQCYVAMAGNIAALTGRK